MSALAKRHRLARLAQALDPDRPPGHKTAIRRDRVQPRTIPDWRITVPPEQHGIALLSPGNVPGIANVKVRSDLAIEGHGTNKHWVAAQIRSFLARNGVEIELPTARRVKDG